MFRWEMVSPSARKVRVSCTLRKSILRHGIEYRGTRDFGNRLRSIWRRNFCGNHAFLRRPSPCGAATLGAAYVDEHLALKCLYAMRELLIIVDRHRDHQYSLAVNVLIWTCDG